MKFSNNNSFFAPFKWMVCLFIFLASGLSSVSFAKETYQKPLTPTYPNFAFTSPNSLFLPVPPFYCSLVIPDYDADCKMDFSVWRPSDGNFYVHRSQLGNMLGFTLGTPTAKPLQGDYDGDGRTDYAVYIKTPIANPLSTPQRSKITWYVDNLFYGGTRQRHFEKYFGTDPYDFPVPADYNGDGKTDIAVFRVEDRGVDGFIPTIYYASAYLSSSSPEKTIEFSPPNLIEISPSQSNQAITDLNFVPAISDYDGDGIADIAIWRNAGQNVGEWKISNSSSVPTIRNEVFGIAGDVPVPGNYAGNDGVIDLAVWRKSNGTWYIKSSATGLTHAIQFGQDGDTLVPGDYDGDGITDPAVRRGGLYYVLGSAAGSSTYTWGLNTDIPVGAVNYPVYTGSTPTHFKCPDSSCKVMCPDTCTN